MPSHAAALPRLRAGVRRRVRKPRGPGWRYKMGMLVGSLLVMFFSLLIGNIVSAGAMGILALVWHRELGWYPTNPEGRIPQTEECAVHVALSVAAVAFAVGGVVFMIGDLGGF